jgi:tRNA-dihydrouridine synthase A
VGIDYGYDEINLNVGCPSDRVKAGFFGAILMKKPNLVAKCISAMKKKSGNCHITVKCRIGVDDQNPKVDLPIFLSQVIDSGVDSVTIHARKALLGKLSPKQNRDVPKLDYALVKEMIKKFPEVNICLNGGVNNLETAAELISDGVGGVMIGRAAYSNPASILLPADEKIFNSRTENISMIEALEVFCSYVDDQMVLGVSFNKISRHLLGVFNGMPGARSFRRIMSEGAFKSGADSELLRKATQVLKY